MSDYLTVAVEAARRAGSYQRDQFGTLDGHEYKAPGDPISEVDHESEQLVLDQLQAAFPDHTILSEERGAVGGPADTHRWVVDPLDGTSNFVRENPEFAVSIALEVDDRLTVGVIYRPMSDTLYAASRDGAADESVPLDVSVVDQLDSALVAIPYASAHADRDDLWATHRALGQRVEGIRSSGSGALDLAYLAAGRIDATVGFNQSRWDCAAGLLLAEVAGATVTDHTGGADAAGTFVGSNGHLHETVLQHVGSEP